MSNFKCTYCDGKVFQTYKYVPVCFDCYNKICHFCSEKQNALIFISGCLGHTFTSSTKNRFMEDPGFVKNGGFDFES